MLSGGLSMKHVFRIHSREQSVHSYRIAVAFLFVLCAAACANGGGTSSAQRVDLESLRYSRGMSDLTSTRTFVPTPSPGRFSICYGHTCRYVATVDLQGPNWNAIRSAFSPPAENAAEERRQIAAAIARLESAVGQRTGTWRDRRESFPGLGEEGQLDCIDEATNSTVYLVMLRNEGLLSWHDVGTRVSRGVSRLMAPHFTATIVERRTGTHYAVDSWFGDNGEPPHIVGLQEWRRGWRPDTADTVGGQEVAE